MLGGNPAPAPWSLTSVTQDKRMRAFDLHKEVWFGVWGEAGLEDTMENQTECLSLIAAVFVSVPPSPKAFQENNLKETIIPALA